MNTRSEKELSGRIINRHGIIRFDEHFVIRSNFPLGLLDPVMKFASITSSFHQLPNGKMISSMEVDIATKQWLDKNEVNQQN